MSHDHEEIKNAYLEGGWNFKTFCSTSLETLGSLQAVKQFRCSSWQCVCKRYFIIALQLEVEMVPLTHRGWLPLQVPFFWHVLFESPLRIYVLLQKYSTYFILPSEPETSVMYPLWNWGGGGGQSFMVTSVIQIAVEPVTKICNGPTNKTDF